MCLRAIGFAHLECCSYPIQGGRRLVGVDRSPDVLGRGREVERVYALLVDSASRLIASQSHEHDAA